MKIKEIESAKCLQPIGYLTKGKVYEIVGRPDKDDKWLTVIDDEGKCATYSAARFEIILTPKGSPDFSEISPIADEVKITQCPETKKAADLANPDIVCPVVEMAEARKTTPITETEMMGLAAQLSAANQPDLSLAEDEWHLIFPDYRNLKEGRASKVPWGGGSNMTSTFIVGRLERYKEKVAELLIENAELKKKLTEASKS